MPNVHIVEKGCRGCSQCVDICPVHVFEPKKLAGDDHQIARVVRTQDCVGCLSCHYVCPSKCVQVTDVQLQTPFYRIEKNVAFVEKFLKTTTATHSITNQQWEQAYRDVAMTLVALSRALPEILGRGSKAVGRRAGTLAAQHLPEAYEQNNLEGILKNLQLRFRNSFDFDFSLSHEKIAMTFKPCSLYDIVEHAGDRAGESILCQLFHDYMAGLVGAFDGKKYRTELVSSGPKCVVNLNRFSI